MIKKISAIVLAVGSLALAFPALAATTSSTANATKVACVGSAVGVRESALVSAIGMFTQAENAAYSARATALQSAYGQTAGNGAIKTAIKGAWSAFTTSMKSARSSWQSSRKSAWSAFSTAVKACKASGIPNDSANSSSEASGN